MNNQNKNDEIEIDLLHIVKLLWKRAWIIVLSMFILGAGMFSYATLFIAPQYEASALMYVNNSSFSVGSTSFSITSSELSAAKSLLSTYVVILKTRLTLEDVIEQANLEYTYEQLYDMVSATSVNSTEVFRITVTSTDPAEAELIVNTIVDILPDRISDIVDGSSVRLVDHAVYPTRRSSPDYTQYAMIGMVVGLVLSAAIIIIVDLMDTTVRNEDYIKQKYDIPVLAVVPEAGSGKSSKYGYGSGYGYGYGYGYYGKYHRTGSRQENKQDDQKSADTSAKS